MKGSFINRSYLLFFTITVIFFFSGCKKDEIQLAQLNTSVINDITVKTAKGGGTIIFDGGSSISACGLCWDLDQNPTVNNFKTIDTLQNGTFNSRLKDLISDTIYYVRAYAVNGAGIAYGNEISFRTSKKTLPIVNTKDVSEITSGSLKVEAEIISNGDGEISACGFCWDMNENPMITGNKSSETITQDKFISLIDGLIPETTYYIRAYITNEVGTAYGNTIVIKTVPVADLSEITISASTFSLTANVNVNSDYGTEITERGFCWGMNENPTKNHNFAISNKGIGSYSYKIAKLNSSTQYYVRAYAQNKYGIIYGNSKSIKTLDKTGTFTDISGNTYKYISIGEQTWMASDLKTGKYRNGDVISDFVSLNSTVGTVGNYYTNPNYGKFYNWYAIADSRNIAPVGWHVATDDDWTQLENFIGGNDVAGGKLKESLEYWFQPNAATDEYGFKALPTGYRFGDGSFSTSGFSMGYWWTATSSTETEAFNRALYYRDTKSRKQSADKRIGMAVRCLRD